MFAIIITYIREFIEASRQRRERLLPLESDSSISDDVIRQRASKFDLLEVYDRCCSCIRHENELINHRMTWFLGVQGLLGAAGGYIFQQYFSATINVLKQVAGADPTKATEGLLLWLFCAGLGALTAVVCWQTVNAGIRAQNAIDRHWRIVADDDTLTTFPDMMGGKSSDLANVGGKLASILPPTFLTIWAIFLVIAGYGLVRIT